LEDLVLHDGIEPSFTD